MSHEVPLRVLVERRGALPVVHVFGEMDMCTVHQAEQPLRHELAAPPPALVLDLLDVTFIDAAGMRMLVDARSAAHRTETDLRVALPRVVLRPLSILGLSDGFAMYGTVADAVAA